MKKFLVRIAYPVERVCWKLVKLVEPKGTGVGVPNMLAPSYVNGMLRMPSNQARGVPSRCPPSLLCLESDLLLIGSVNDMSCI